MDVDEDDKYLDYLFNSALNYIYMRPVDEISSYPKNGSLKKKFCLENKINFAYIRRNRE